MKRPFTVIHGGLSGRRRSARPSQIIDGRGTAAPATRSSRDEFLACREYVELVEQIEDLPFVTKDDAGRRRFWPVITGANYAQDHARGRSWARLVVPLLKLNAGAEMLGWILEDMIAGGESNDVVLGFVHELGEQLAYARTSLAFVLAATEERAPLDMQQTYASVRASLAASVADAL